MIRSYSPGDMERHIRGNNSQSLMQRVFDLQELSIMIHRRELGQEDRNVPNYSTLINDFGNEGKEYIAEAQFTFRSMPDGKRKDELIAKSLEINKFPSIEFPLGSHPVEQAKLAVEDMLKMHGFNPSDYGNLWVVHKGQIHTHRLIDEYNQTSYSFMLPAQSEIRRIEKIILGNN